MKVVDSKFSKKWLRMTCWPVPQEQRAELQRGGSQQSPSVGTSLQGQRPPTHQAQGISPAPLLLLRMKARQCPSSAG